MTVGDLARLSEWLHRPRWAARRISDRPRYWVGGSTWTGDRTKALRFSSTEALDEAIAAAYGEDPGHYEWVCLEDL